MKINVEITGSTPMLMNRFNDEESISNQPRNKNLLPRDHAEKTAYKLSNGYLYIPSPNIFSCIICAGKFHKIGKNKVTTVRSSLVPAGLAINTIDCLLNTKEFEVDSRSVVIPSTGGRIMKHRARLDKWALSFEIEIDETVFSESFVRQLVDDAGSKVGLGDFRPDRKGPFGKFKVTKWKKIKE